MTTKNSERLDRALATFNEAVKSENLDIRSNLYLDCIARSVFSCF